MTYPYTFPFLGKKAYKNGFDILYAWGISPVYFAQRQDIEIAEIAVGLNDGPLAGISGLVAFGRIENKVSTFTVRPDLWVYWANVEAFVEPVPAYNFDARIGHNFVNPRQADRSVTIWFGGFYQKIKADTDGHIPISSLFPDITPEQADEIRERLGEWVEGLPPAQEIIMREVIQKINDFFDGREPGNSEIHYVLDKRVAEPWNLIFGAQYQHNKNWQIRSEIGTFEKRTQFLLNLNYRFAGFRKR